jgi:hypothetical protein
MKVWKKFSAVALALVMVLALGATAFAEDADGDLTDDGIVGDFTTKDTTREDEFTDAVIMYKEITAFNPETSTVKAPTITYTYTIAAGEAGKDIYDAKDKHTPEGNAHVQTKAGIGAPAISGSVDNKATWTSGTLQLTTAVELTASSGNGTKNSFPLKVDFTGIDFNPGTLPTGKTASDFGAGVYRYVITEGVSAPSTGADVAAKKALAGIKDGTISDTRYLDVYVNGDGKIYGWVCFAYNNSIDARDAETAEANNVVAKAYKTEGFVAGTDSSTNAAVTADQYYTFNFELTKVVEKDNYSATTNPHQFPFTITLANTAVTANVLPIMTFTDDVTANEPTYNTSATKVTQTALTAGAIAGEWKPTIAHHAAVKYVGIPCGTTVTIKEQNDVSSVTYSAAITHADTNGATKSIFTDEYSSDAVIRTTALENPEKNYTKSGTGGAVTFTNTMLEISPTGVALRYAPYLAMLGAGVVALPLTLRKKEELF